MGVILPHTPPRAGPVLYSPRSSFNKTLEGFTSFSNLVARIPTGVISTSYSAPDKHPLRTANLALTAYMIYLRTGLRQDVTTGSHPIFDPGLSNDYFTELLLQLTTHKGVKDLLQRRHFI
ncbi:hypothetical protein J6590_003972 [Homalodisca vitripennis]|nr:hypothetical protein J6590_003972 [Homalodisca vitripennis]